LEVEVADVCVLLSIGVAVPGVTIVVRDDLYQLVGVSGDHAVRSQVVVCQWTETVANAAVILWGRSGWIAHNCYFYASTRK